MFAFIKKKKKKADLAVGVGSEALSQVKSLFLTQAAAGWAINDSFFVFVTLEKKKKKKLSQNCKHFVEPDGIGRVHNGSMKCSLLSFCTRAHDTSLCRTSTPHRLSSSPRTLPATRRTGTSCAGRRTSPVGNIFQTFMLLLEWIATVKLYYGSSLF